MTAPKNSFRVGSYRYYRHPERPVTAVSVTTVLKQKNKPAIAGSQIRKAAEYAVQNRERLSGLTEAEQIRLIKGTQYERNPASRIGDIVHAWVDQYIKTSQTPWEAGPLSMNEGFDDEETVVYEDAPITARRMWRQFEGFERRYSPKWLDAEFTVWSHQYGYAGTADWAAEIRGALVLGDTKTGKGVWPETGLQLAALGNADVMLTDEGDEVPMPKWDRYGVLHLRPTFARLVPVEQIDSCFRAFLGLKADLDHDIENAEKVLLDSPQIKTDYKGV